jgi:hypothetical protein
MVAEKALLASAAGTERLAFAWALTWTPGAEPESPSLLASFSGRAVRAGSSAMILRMEARISSIDGS